MRILILTNNYPPVIDGVGDHSFFLSAALKRKGYFVSIVCSASKQIVTSVHADVYPIIQKWNKRGYRTALKKIKEISPDCILLQYVPYGFQRIGIPWRIVLFIKEIRKAEIPCLIHFHEMFVRLTWKLRKIYVIGIIQRFLIYLMCRYASGIITSTSFYKKELSRFTSKPITVIPIPPNFNTDFVFDKVRLSNLLKVISPDGYPIIATFGARDNTMLAAVFKKILIRNEKIKFLICGGANPNLFTELGNAVHFTGYLNAEDLAYYLKTASVFFLPDYADKRGRGGSSRKSGSLAAALFCGLPVIGISGDNNGIELLENSSIILENYYDIDAIVNSILAALGRSHDEKNLSDRSLNWDEIAQMYFDEKLE